MRYVGQAFELPVAVAGRQGSRTAWLGRLEEAFHADHERTYGHRTDNLIEIVNLRVVVPRAESTVAAARAAPPRATAGALRSIARPAYFGPEHGVRDTPVVRRAST